MKQEVRRALVALVKTAPRGKVDPAALAHVRAVVEYATEGSEQAQGVLGALELIGEAAGIEEPARPAGRFQAVS